MFMLLLGMVVKRISGILAGFEIDPLRALSIWKPFAGAHAFDTTVHIYP